MKKEYLDLLNARASREREYYSGQKDILDYHEGEKPSIL